MERVRVCYHSIISRSVTHFCARCLHVQLIVFVASVWSLSAHFISAQECDFVTLGLVRSVSTYVLFSLLAFAVFRHERMMIAVLALHVQVRGLSCTHPLLRVSVWSTSSTRVSIFALRRDVSVSLCSSCFFFSASSVGTVCIGCRVRFVTLLERLPLCTCSPG